MESWKNQAYELIDKIRRELHILKTMAYPDENDTWESLVVKHLIDEKPEKQRELIKKENINKYETFKQGAHTMEILLKEEFGNKSFRCTANLVYG